MRGSSGFARRAIAARRCRPRAVPGVRRHRCGAPRARCARLTAIAGDAAAQAPVRCGIDTVEIARIERLLDETPASELDKIFSTRELTDSGDGPGRAASLAARYAAKEACVKLFPRELALAEIEPADFSIERDAYGAPQVVCSARAELVLGRQRLRAIAVSLTHDRVSASAVAMALPAQADAPLAGRLIYR